MSQAEELLNSINEELPNDITTPLVEEHIVIGPDRFIIVPEPLKRIAVQNDHKVETVTFDCPRYWDEHDLSKMYIYINYLRPDGLKGVYLAKNVTVDEADPNLMHFTWNIGRELTIINGPISFLVCAIQTDSQGYRKLHWNSEINTEMTISLGLESVEVINEQYPDIITDLLTRMDYILVGDGTVLDKSLTLENFGADAKTVGDRFNAVETKLDNEIEETNTEVDAINTTLNNLQEQIVSNDQDIISLQEQINSNDEDISNININIQTIFAKLNEHNPIYEQSKLSNKYNIPNSLQNNADHTILILDPKITSYEKNMIVKLDTEANEITTEEFNSRLFPYFTSNTAIDGFIFSGSSAGWEAFDGDRSTEFSGTCTISCPIYVKPKTIAIYAKETQSDNGLIRITGIKKDGTEVVLFSKDFYGTFEETITVDTNEYFHAFEFHGPNFLSGDTDLYEISFESGMKSKISTKAVYLNINGLGEVLIDGSIEMNKKYELVYDGTVFKAREVI